MGTISVTATGRAAAKPDITRVDLSINGTRKEYSEAFDDSVSNGNEIKDVLEAAGIGRESLKTTDFRIEPRYETVKTEGNGYKEAFMGYQYLQSLAFEFPADNSVLGKVLYSISRCRCAPRISFSYRSSSMEEARTEALKEAIKTAEKRAGIMAEASGVRITGIRSIGSPEPSRPMMKAMAFRANADGFAEESAYSLDFQPEDIEVTESISIEWDIA